MSAAFQTFAGVDPHPDPFEKAAMLVRGVTQGDPFTEGNKRTGFRVAEYCLTQLGYDLPDAFLVDDAVGLCLDVSAGRLRAIAAIAARLRQLWRQAG